MTDDDLMAHIPADQRKIWEKGAELLWKHYLSDAVLALLARQGTVSKDDLESHFRKMCESDKVNFVDRAAMQGAIKALNGTPPAG